MDPIINNEDSVFSNARTPLLPPLNSKDLIKGAETEVTKPNETLKESEVCEFLRKNPRFLTAFILDNYSAEIIERWFHKKLKLNETKGLEERNSHLYRYNMYIHLNKQELFQSVVETIKAYPSQNQVLWELGFCVSTAIGVDGFNVFTIQKESRYMNVIVGSTVPFQLNQPVSTVSVPTRSLPMVNEVITMGKAIRLERKRTDNKASSSAISSDSEANFALYLPVINKAHDTVAVLEMWRLNHKFFERDEDTAWSYLAWGSTALHYLHLYTDITKQRKLQTYLLHVAHSVFEDMGSMEVVVKKIMNYAQELVDADRASLFLVDAKSKELYATVFDVGSTADDDELSKTPRSLKSEIRFPIGTGIAGHVAKTGQILNITDAYQDKRFNKSVDLKTGYRTKSILCMPVYIRKSIIGVVQMVNKHEGVFNKSDVDAFKMFATYCGLALHHTKLYKQIKRSEQKYKVAIEVLSYHNTCNKMELMEIMNCNAPLVVFLDDFYLNPYTIGDLDKVRYTVKMFENLFEMTLCDKYCLYRFVSAVKKNYRNVPYHNWTHGFSVANSMYNILKRDDGIFTKNERLALFVGALCHDLDHRGRSNKYMLDTESPLATMYSTSTMEHHHFNQTVIILQQDGHNIFSQLKNTELKHVLGILKNCIIATDLANFFPNRDKMKHLLDKQLYDWKIHEHRSIALAISMTAADLSAAAKPWHIQTETAKVIFLEFYEQGDADKSAGRELLPMMDRTRPEEQPSSQVCFLKLICNGCYSLLETLLPRSKPLHDMCQQNLKKWLLIDASVRKYVEGGGKTPADINKYLQESILKFHT